MTSETETLRVAIEAALRRRDPNASLRKYPAESDRALWSATWLRVETSARGYGATADFDALRALAVACGLRDNGSDPAEEVERLTMALDDANNLASCQRDTIETLTRALHDAADRLGCADYDDVCAAVADALDDAERREREHVDEANALRMERDRLYDVTRGALDDLAKVRAELDAARAVLRESEETARQASMRAEETVALLRTSIADLVPLRVAVREYLAARKAVTEVRYADESVAAHERVAAAFAMLGRLV